MPRFSCVWRSLFVAVAVTLGLVASVGVAPLRAQQRPGPPRRPAAAAAPARTPARPIAVHEIALREVTPNDVYRFEPAVTVARAGDRLRFRVASGAPHSVVIDGDSLSDPIRRAWNAVLVDRMEDLTSPLLFAGRIYEIVVPAVPPGVYRYYCLPHLGYSMNGEVRVVP